MPENRKLLDRRTVERYIDKGLVKASEFQTYVKNLPDEANNAQWVQMDLHDAEITDESQGDETDHDEDTDESDSSEGA